MEAKTKEELEREKLRLECEKLELDLETGKQGKQKGITRWLQIAPLLSVFVAVFVAIFGSAITVSEFTFQQKQEQESRAQVAIRNDIGDLINFPQSTSSAGKGIYLLSDLNRLTKDHKDNRDLVTQSLERLIRDDCDFTLIRDTQFDEDAYSVWPEYNDSLSKDQKLNSTILIKIWQAFDAIRNSDTPLVQHLAYDTNKNTLVMHDLDPKDSKLSQHAQLLKHLTTLSIKHLSCLGENSDRRQYALDGLEHATKNESFVASIDKASKDAARTRMRPSP